MRILVASDIHGSKKSALLLRAQIQKRCPDLVVLLGDLLYHGPRNPLPDGYAPLETVSVLADLGAPLLAVRGNCDADVDRHVLPFHPAESAWLFADGLRILAVHGHLLPPAPPFPGLEQGMIVLSGHTHIPRAEQQHGIFFWNPGSAALPKEDRPPSFGIYEDHEFQVLSFDGLTLLTSRVA